MDPRLLKYLLILTKLCIVTVALFATYLLCYHLLPYAGKVMGHLPAYFLPFFIALALALLIEPIVKKLQKHLRLSRGIAVFLSLVALWGGSFLVLLVIAGKLAAELIQLCRYLSNYSGWIGGEITSWAQKIQELYFSLNIPLAVKEDLLQNLDSVIWGMRDLVQSSVNTLVKLLSDLPEWIAIFLVATVGAFFISRDKEKIIDFLFRWLPQEKVKKLRQLVSELGGALLGFLKAQMILLSLTAVITIGGLSLLGVNYAVTLGIIVGFLDIIPVLGPGMVFVPWILLQFAFGNLAFGCGLLILYGIMIIIRQLVEARIVAQSLGLHPLGTLLGLYIGLKAGGFGGMILALILLVAVKAIYKSGMLNGNAHPTQV